MAARSIGFYAVTLVALCAPARGYQGAAAPRALPLATSRRRSWPTAVANKNVEQTVDTSRERIMTFAYDDEADTRVNVRRRKGTGKGMSGSELGADEYDTIVIGSGVGGLACGALSAKYGDKTLVLEAHVKPGGSAHTFTRVHEGGEFSFEVGPSIFEGLHAPSINPLRMIIDILGEELPAKTYSGIGYWTPDGFWRFPIGSREAFEQTLLEQCGADGPLAVSQWNALRARLKTLSGSTQAVSLLNLRQDAGFLATTAGSLPYVASHPDIFGDLGMLFDSLHKVVDEYVTVPFLRNFIDTMCIFCGFPAKGAMTAHMLYILERFFEPEAAFSVPIGGTCQIGNALVRGLEKFGGELQLNAHVEQVLVEGGRAVGVRLRNGRVVRARKAVVSNLTPFDTAKLLRRTAEEEAAQAEPLPAAVREWTSQLGKLPRHGAIMHLFVAIRADGLDLSHLRGDCAHLVVQDWGRSLQDSQNLCSFFIPSLLDPSVCPAGTHVIHVYSSGGEPYEPWEALDADPAAYEAYKRQRAEVRRARALRARARRVIGRPLMRRARLSRRACRRAGAGAMRPAHGARLSRAPLPSPPCCAGPLARSRARDPRRARARALRRDRLSTRARGIPEARSRHLWHGVGGGPCRAVRRPPQVRAPPPRPRLRRFFCARAVCQLAARGCWPATASRQGRWGAGAPAACAPRAHSPPHGRCPPRPRAHRPARTPAGTCSRSPFRT